MRKHCRTSTWSLRRTSPTAVLAAQGNAKAERGLRKVAGVTIGISRKGDITRRSRSPVIRKSASPLSAALIRTLLSRTIRSAFIRQQRIQRAICQALDGCFLAQPVHSFSQLFPGRPTKPLVMLHRHHDHHRSTVSGDSHRRTLSGVEQAAEAVLGIFGGGAGNASCREYSVKLTK